MIQVILLVLLALVVMGCAAAGPNELAGSSDGDGFWQGLWHGIIAPIAFIVSLFVDRINVYEVCNNGGWYDFGFLWGISAVARAEYIWGQRIRYNRLAHSIQKGVTPY